MTRPECAATHALLALYREPARAPGLPGPSWSDVLGAARRSRTLGHLGHVLSQAGVTDGIDARVRTHLTSVAILIAHRRRLLRHELSEFARAVEAFEGPILLLKGAAYEALDLPLASGRQAADIDLLVERIRLAEIERSIRSAGWVPAELDAYDERYYREWSHELPPFTNPARGIEADIHHSISPAMRGTGVDTGALIEKSIEVDLGGRRRYRVLQPVDQLIHCALHTFKDSDLTLRLRESMDFDLLYRHHATRNPHLAEDLAARALELGQARPLWWSIHFARRWLGSLVPERLLTALPAPSRASIASMDLLCDRAMLPGSRLERSGLDRLASITLLARYQYKRLPLCKLIPHLLVKSRRRFEQLATGAERP